MLGAIIHSMLSACLLTIAVTASGERFVRFESTDGFSVLYPAGWTRVGTDNGIGPSATRLDIVSSTPRVQGVVIGRGQAEIIARRLAGQDTEFVSRLERGSLEEEVVISTRNLAEEGGRRPPCGDPLEVTSRAEEGPGAFTVNLWLMCEIGHAQFLILVRYWDGEPRAEEFRLIGRVVAASLQRTRSSD